MSEAAAQNLQPDPQTGEMISKRFDFCWQQECGSLKDTSELKRRQKEREKASKKAEKVSISDA
jgi:hypothetical protein